MKINWHLSGSEIEQESFRKIEAEMGPHSFDPAEWRVVRRLIHTTADFSIAQDLLFLNNPVAAGREALRRGCFIFCDSNMVRSGLSLEKLRKVNPAYGPDMIRCHVADPEVAAAARVKGVCRSLASMDKIRPFLENAIILVGNAPLLLAGMARMIIEEKLRPSLVIGMPVGFVHVVEAKQMIMATDVPQIVLKGRRGGSALAVAALHGILEYMSEKT